MGSLIVVAAIAIIVFVWVQKTRMARKKWLNHLDLPGTWELADNASTTFEFIGDLSGGNYIFSSNNMLESGGWQISGNMLLLTPNDAKEGTSFEIRWFKLGEIGIHGPGRERQVYQKRVDNVVRLRPRA